MDTKERIDGRKNPQETANFISSLFFGWTASIMWKGARTDLKVKDLYDPLQSDESERLGDLLEREWKKELIKAEEKFVVETNGKKKMMRKPNLLWAITRVFWFPFMLQGVLQLIQSACLRVMQPVLQRWIIAYFNPGQNLTTRNEVLLNAGLLFIANLAFVFITHHAVLGTRKIGMCIRVACCSMIYRKVLRLDKSAVSNTAEGRVANLISNDVARFDSVLIFLHHIWIMPIQVLLMGYVMWDTIGVAAASIGIGAMLIQTIPVIGYFGKLSTKLRSKIAVETDKRIQLMSEMISGIQVLKMYAWENPFELLVSKVREAEIKMISLMSYVRGFCVSMMGFTEKVTLYLTLITFVLMGNPLTAETTFLLSSLFNGLKFTCAIYVPEAMLSAGETVASLERLTEFLLLDEIKDTEKFVTTVNNGHQTLNKETIGQQIKHGVGIEMIQVAANWVHGQLPPTLCAVSLKVQSQSLCAVVGPVASGKSSLLHLLLGELPIGAGKLSLFTGDNSHTQITGRDIRISYTSQEPWLFSATIRDNILFGQPYDERRYKEVTRVCALLEDFEQLPQGDLTFVGERGASLSGGQRARVNLARAVYRDAELYLLDDPLSAVDARVARQLFEECITGFLKGKTRILVTHQLQYLRSADTVVVLDCGTVKHQGTYAQLVERNCQIFDSEDSGNPVEFNGRYDKILECTNTVLTAVDSHQLPEVLEKREVPQDLSKEVIATGELSNKVYWGYFKAGGNPCTLAFLVTAFIVSQITLNGTDYWVTYWTNQNTLRASSQSNKSATNTLRFSNDTESDHQQTEWEWFDGSGLIRSRPAIYVYTVSIIGCIILVLLRSMLFMKICVNASRTLHASMLANLLQAPMRFFNTNPSGRIVNRFSKDMGTMDELMPKTMLHFLQTFHTATGVFLMVIIVNNWMILPGIVMGGIIYFVKTYYLKTVQDVKRLEGITKSPVFSHVNSTLDGLSTIRSRGATAEGLLRREFDRYQDVHTGAWYLYIGTFCAFGLFVDLVSCLFIACVCFSVILIDDGNTLPGFVGLAITQSLMLIGVVQHGVRQSTEATTQMTSVERILQYTNLPKEGPYTTKNPPPRTWPSEGGLVFKNVTMRYADNKPPVLKSLNLNIKPGWKVGIVGRTGAGKSSLISALFSLTGDGLEGEIVLDGIDTKSIGLHELRPRISIIPQEPILFSASLRYNLDPFDQYSDAELWDSLREVELGDAVPSLDFHVVGGGANFSVGQRQLICLARAILGNNRVLVLDEATANVDGSTDALIQTTIRRKFADRTVLTIAHRLNTIMDSDRVLVMAGGCIVEFGHPHMLLKNQDGHFSQMLQQTGTAVSKKLTKIAESAYLTSAENTEELINETGAVCNDQTTYL